MGSLSEIEERIYRFVKKNVSGSDLAHAMDHVECVVKFVKKIGAEEKVNMKILLAAAYLHDIVPRNRVKGNSSHYVESARKAEEFLQKIGFEKEEIKGVIGAILTSSYEAYLRGVKPASREAEVLRDADLLDAMGARGIARVFAFAGYYGSSELGKVNWDPENPPKYKMNTEGPDPNPIYHFASKLLRLKKLMLTATGRRLAEERHRFMVEFLKRYKLEMECKL